MAENKTFAGLLKLHVPNELNVMAAVIGEKAVSAKTAQGSPECIGGMTNVRSTLGHLGLGAMSR
ncbi:hypothetical protein RUM44_000504 [Polyplax serrata]|uniref:Uncharacterized protein n=1 Tax=Polyplax serrata TaxID=468196 RepID=A0ABR1B5L9_POLSC